MSPCHARIWNFDQSISYFSTWYSLIIELTFVSKETFLTKTRNSLELEVWILHQFFMINTLILRLILFQYINTYIGWRHLVPEFMIFPWIWEGLLRLEAVKRTIICHLKCFYTPYKVCKSGIYGEFRYEWIFEISNPHCTAYQGF